MDAKSEVLCPRSGRLDDECALPAQPPKAAVRNGLAGRDEEKLRRDAQRVYEKYLSLFGEYDALGRGIDQLCPPSFPILKR